MGRRRWLGENLWRGQFRLADSRHLNDLADLLQRRMCSLYGRYANRDHPSVCVASAIYEDGRFEAPGVPSLRA